MRLIGLKVLDGTGAGKTSDVIAAIEFAIAHRAQLGIDVINLSLGHVILESAATDPLVQAVERASGAGIVVVTAAGNFGSNPVTGLVGYAGITSPGNAPSAITVGAENLQGTVDRSDDRVPVYSSRGPSWYDGHAKPDLVAPGHRLPSVASPGSTLYQLLAAGYPDKLIYTSGTVQNGLSAGVASYMVLSGTSMAAAVTSGAVATILDGSRRANPGTTLTPTAIKAILEFTALSLTDAAGVPYDGLTQGTGALNAAGAIALAESVNPYAPGRDPMADHERGTCDRH